MFYQCYSVRKIEIKHYPVAYPVDEIKKTLTNMQNPAKFVELQHQLNQDNHYLYWSMAATQGGPSPQSLRWGPRHKCPQVGRFRWDGPRTLRVGGIGAIWSSPQILIYITTVQYTLLSIQAYFCRTELNDPARDSESRKGKEHFEHFANVFTVDNFLSHYMCLT